jgi:hypothetical protein
MYGIFKYPMCRIKSIKNQFKQLSTSESNYYYHTKEEFLCGLDIVLHKYGLKFAGRIECPGEYGELNIGICPIDSEEIIGSAQLNWNSRDITPGKIVCDAYIF